jgi:hypothetical protein
MIDTFKYKLVGDLVVGDIIFANGKFQPIEAITRSYHPRESTLYFYGADEGYMELPNNHVVIVSL